MRKWGQGLEARRVGARRERGGEGVGIQTEKKLGPEGWRPEPRFGGGPKGGEPKISRFFFPSPTTHFRSFLSLEDLLVEFSSVLGVGWDLKCARVRPQVVVWKPRRPAGKVLDPLEWNYLGHRAREKKKNENFRKQKKLCARIKKYNKEEES